MPEKKAEFSGEKVIAEFERLSRDAAAAQREALRRILAGNAAAEYLQGRGLAGRTDPDSFRACVPLATHADFEPYIARIADGDTSAVLTATPVTAISLRFVVVSSHYYLPAAVQLTMHYMLADIRPMHAAPARRRGSASTFSSTTRSSSQRCRRTRLPSLSGTGS
jgi:hypothetical protein